VVREWRAMVWLVLFINACRDTSRTDNSWPERFMTRSHGSDVVYTERTTRAKWREGVEAQRSGVAT
jgi:hypothetical protein